VLWFQNPRKKCHMKILTIVPAERRRLLIWTDSGSQVLLWESGAIEIMMKNEGGHVLLRRVRNRGGGQGRRRWTVETEWQTVSWAVETIASSRLCLFRGDEVPGGFGPLGTWRFVKMSKNTDAFNTYHKVGRRFCASWIFRVRRVLIMLNAFEWSISYFIWQDIPLCLRFCPEIFPCQFDYGRS